MRDLDEQLKSVAVRIGIVSIVQALLVPALAFVTHQENLTVISIGIGIFAFGFGLLSAASRELWVLAPVSAGTLGLIALLSVGGSALMLVGLPLALVLAKWFFTIGPIERELWRLRLDR